MKITPPENFDSRRNRRPIRPRWNRRAIAIFSIAALLPAAAYSARAQATTASTWTVTLVLPRNLVAGQPATLAAFGVDGKLAPGVSVDLSGVQRVQTDKTGRAYFITPATGSVLIARASGNSTAALVNPAPSESVAPAAAAAHSAISVAPFVSLRDAFTICGPGLRGDADANRVKINGEASLIVAASPYCVAVL